MTRIKTTRPRCRTPELVGDRGRDEVSEKTGIVVLTPRSEALARALSKIGFVPNIVLTSSLDGTFIP